MCYNNLLNILQYKNIMKSIGKFTPFEMALQKYNQLKLKNLMGKILSVKEQAFMIYFDNQVVKKTSDEVTRLQSVTLFNTLLD